MSDGSLAAQFRGTVKYNEIPKRVQGYTEEGNEFLIFEGMNTDDAMPFSPRTTGQSYSARPPKSSRGMPSEAGGRKRKRQPKSSHPIENTVVGMMDETCYNKDFHAERRGFAGGDSPLVALMLEFQAWLHSRRSPDGSCAEQLGVKGLGDHRPPNAPWTWNRYRDGSHDRILRPAARGCLTSTKSEAQFLNPPAETSARY